MVGRSQWMRTVKFTLLWQHVSRLDVSEKPFSFPCLTSASENNYQAMLDMQGEKPDAEPLSSGDCFHPAYRYTRVVHCHRLWLEVETHSGATITGQHPECTVRATPKKENAPNSLSSSVSSLERDWCPQTFFCSILRTPPRQSR